MRVIRFMNRDLDSSVAIFQVEFRALRFQQGTSEKLAGRSCQSGDYFTQTRSGASVKQWHPPAAYEPHKATRFSR